MAQLNHMGPLEEGAKTGRRLGNCKKKPGEIPLKNYGQGLALKKRTINHNCSGKGKRLKAHNIKEI